MLLIDTGENNKISDSQNSYGFQSGVEYKINDDISIHFEYSYLNTDLTTNIQNNNQVETLTHKDMSGVSLALKYIF